MTMSVTIKHNGPSFYESEYEAYNPKTGEHAPYSPNGTLKEGEEVIVTIYDTMAVRVTEKKKD